MTRINCVLPEELEDQHLLAEYRELPRVYGYVKAAEDRGLSPLTAKIPDSYRLGEGHVTFFYDKLLYLAERHQAICRELESRDYKLNFKEPPPSIFEVRVGWLGDWEPTEEEIEVNRSRIRERLSK